MHQAKRLLRILHLSDLHFGPPFVAEVGEAMVRIAPHLNADAIVVSGDFTQRAKEEQFRTTNRAPCAYLLSGSMKAIWHLLARQGRHNIQKWGHPFDGLRWIGSVLRPSDEAGAQILLIQKCLRLAATL